MAVPGLLGTLTGLFTGISGDSSAQSRTDSYALAAAFISRRPIFGRGFLTFLPSYRILDNQYLGLAIETGVVGVATLLFLFLCGIFIGPRHSPAQSPRMPAIRSLANSLAASVASAAASFRIVRRIFFSDGGDSGVLHARLPGRPGPPHLAASSVLSSRCTA